MPRNGSGGYSLPTNTWNPATNGVSATAADYQALINDIAAAIQQSLSADGQTPVTGNINMGGNRLTGLAAGTATGQSLRWEQLFSQGLQQDVAAAATTDIGAALSTLVNVTGTGTITSFGTNYNGPRFLRFAGVCTLTNSATLVLPGGANITTAAGDSAIAVPLGNPATGWRVVVYTQATGVFLPDGSVVTQELADDAVTFAKVQNIATARILGRTTAGSGDIEELTGAQAAALLPIRAPVQPVAASVAGNALTVTLNPTVLDFRSATLGSGAVNTRTVAAALNLTIPSGATLGTINAVASRIALLAIDNAGTVEIAAVNMAGGTNLDETTLISTTAISGTANSATVIYSQTARTNVPFRVVGYVESTQTTAGTWASAPSLVQGQGGQAMAAMQSLGWGQTWQNVTGSRVWGTTYYNTTGKPIVCNITLSATSSSQFTVNGAAATSANFTANLIQSGLIVPPGASYAVTGGSGTVSAWHELR